MCVSATPSGTGATPHKTRENNPRMLPLTPVTPFNQATCLSPLSSRTALTTPLASPTESSLGHYSVLSKPVTALRQRIRSKRRSIVFIFPPKVDPSLCFVATFTVGSIKAQRIGVHGAHGCGLIQDLCSKLVMISKISQLCCAYIYLKYLKCMQ